jgi:hypothetical protein
MRRCYLLTWVLVMGCSDPTAAPNVTTDIPDTTAPDTTAPIDTAPSDASAAEDVGLDLPAPDVTPWTIETVPLGGACPLATRLGGFSVEILADESIASGRVAEGVNPISVLEDVGGEGDCRLLRKEFPFCDPLCEAGTTCAQGGICVPFPENQDVGTVHITGLEKEVTMEVVSPGNLYYDLNLPQPAFVPDSLIRLYTDDGWAGPFGLYGVGSVPIALVEPLWAVQEGLDLSFSWNAPEDDVRSEVAVTLNIDQHGSSPVVISCVFPDTGEASIPSTLLDTLMAFGVSGYPNARVFRRTADSLEVPGGCVDFMVGSPVNPDIEVGGHYPCDSDFDCPPGLTCNVAIQSCQ